MTAPTDTPEPEHGIELAVVRQPGRRVQGWLMVLAVIVAAGSMIWSSSHLGGVVDRISATQTLSVQRNKRIAANTTNIQATLDIVKAATSPEAKAATQKVLRDAISNIDCNNRLALQGLIDQLISDGILRPSDVSLATNCPTTTTTTEAAR